MHIYRIEKEYQDSPVQVSVVDGTLVNNFPAVQNVTGSVSVTNPVNVNVIHDFFKQAGDINMLMQADDNTYFIWYKDDDVALAVYNYMSSRGCYSDNVKLELKLRLKKTALVNWSKPLKI